MGATEGLAHGSLSEPFHNKSPAPMKQWYYNDGGTQSGPVTENELTGLLEQGKVSPETLVWSEGMKEWTALRLIDDFSVSPYAPPALSGDAAVSWDHYTPTGSQIRPWMRYWARGFDIGLAGVVAGVVLEFVYPQALELPDVVFGIILTAIYIPVEALLLSSFGATPFKALLNIRVRNQNGDKLSFREALARSLNVWIRGLGLGLPIITLITNYTSYQRLSSSGATSWDAEGNHTVSHRKLAVWRILLIWILLIGFIALIAYGQEGA